MSSIYDKMNLRPNERRLVTVILIVVFLILNAIFVWPQFSEYGKLQTRKKVAMDLSRQYQTEVDNTGRYQKQLADLEKAGARVDSEDQALKLSTTVQNQAALSGVQVNRYDPVRKTEGGAAKPNQFFEEQSGLINVVTEEKSLVDFLYSLGVGGSLIRVRSMTLNPDPVRQKLQGNLTLVASYAKKAPPKIAAPSATPAAAVVRTTNSGIKPASPFKTNAPTQAPASTKK